MDAWRAEASRRSISIRSNLPPTPTATRLAYDVYRVTSTRFIQPSQFLSRSARLENLHKLLVMHEECKNQIYEILKPMPFMTQTAADKFLHL